MINTIEFEKLLTPVTNRAVEYAELLSRSFRREWEIAEASIDALTDVLDGDREIARYLKLAFALTSRTLTDSFKFGVRHTTEEIGKYLCGIFMTLSVETVYALFLDSDDAVISCNYMGEGTVNSSNIYPRRILERAIKCGAKKIIIAHNHPGGFAKPSAEDSTSMKMISDLFRSSGNELVGYYVVGNGEYTYSEIEYGG